MSYLNENFLLSNEFARKLYFDYAKDMPIFDYHCHLSEKEILANEPCKDLCDLWLGGDHYKWRLMRNFGIDEPYVTGDKSPEDWKRLCEDPEVDLVYNATPWELHVPIALSPIYFVISSKT